MRRVLVAFLVVMAVAPSASAVPFTERYAHLYGIEHEGATVWSVVRSRDDWSRAWVAIYRPDEGTVEIAHGDPDIVFDQAGEIGWAEGELASVIWEYDPAAEPQYGDVVGDGSVTVDMRFVAGGVPGFGGACACDGLAWAGTRREAEVTGAITSTSGVALGLHRASGFISQRVVV